MGDSQLPIEVVPRCRVHVDVSEVRIDKVGPPEYPLPALVFSAPCDAKNCLAEVAWAAVRACQELGVPHNVILRRVPTTLSLEIFLIPRQQQRHHNVAAAGFNAAVMEV